MKRLLWMLALAVPGLGAMSLESKKPQPPPFETLSAYGLFAGRLADQKPAEGVLPYGLNTPLFSDYAEKLRFVRMPEGETVAYNPDSVLGFPVGTVLAKTFYYPNDARDPAKGRRLLETRLLVHESQGWKAYPYVWNDEQTDAVLEVAGDRKEVGWTDGSGTRRKLMYTVPNMNQCKGCHVSGNKMVPIGPSARQLNGIFTYSDGSENQLSRWSRLKWLQKLPELAEVPKLAIWNDPATGTVAERARAWLDINCAHCHSPQGPARTSGLDLRIRQNDPTLLGINKTPVAAGRGSGGRQFDIVAGHPEKSILVYRLESVDPGIRMPELSRQLVHEESVELVKEWIKNLKP
ncbi:SO2930 family diheme c-type cytochrome [Tellurirhabdus rosea]|uniref:SO2930 family diheme c-type cytochrome n=1 Tax=Tellurirhabdus rosea TaxID=2674997 RepID=UPI002255EE2C|nr:SO2930 family diheme c-type cytochrome [Tellurirhabdus rosea]